MAGKKQIGSLEKLMGREISFRAAREAHRLAWEAPGPQKKLPGWLGKRIGLGPELMGPLRKLPRSPEKLPCWLEKLTEGEMSFWAAREAPRLTREASRARNKLPG